MSDTGALGFNEPVAVVDTPPGRGEPATGTALCLSGGGYRAMLFHLGSLRRLNEIGYLKKLDRISSVSGGSIVAAVLGASWSGLDFDADGRSTKFEQLVVEPVRRLAGKTIDRKAIFSGALTPGSISDRIVAAYEKHLFKGKTLQDLPDEPRFVINATNVQSGALWRFMKPYMRDWKVGEVKNPTVSLAVAVAASSAFPPVLSPADLELDPSTFTPNSGAGLQKEPFTSDVILTDGGVYDNLGLETAWKRCRTILVSDGGGQLEADADPKRDWLGHTTRVLGIIDNQVRSLRKRQLIEALRNERRLGAYWGIRTNIAEYGLDDPLDCPYARTLEVAGTKTRLKHLDAERQERLINWGYAVCDAAMRRHVDTALPQPDGFPYPQTGV